jgi:peptide/nickel transport system permease protein
MALADIVSRRTRLDRQFDELRRREEAGELRSASSSRVVRKFLNNRLAVLGLVVFTVILLASILRLCSRRGTRARSTSAP